MYDATILAAILQVADPEPASPEAIRNLSVDIAGHVPGLRGRKLRHQVHRIRSTMPPVVPSGSATQHHRVHVRRPQDAIGVQVKAKNITLGSSVLIRHRGVSLPVYVIERHTIEGVDGNSVAYKVKDAMNGRVFPGLRSASALHTLDWTPPAVSPGRPFRKRTPTIPGITPFAPDQEPTPTLPKFPLAGDTRP